MAGGGIRPLVACATAGAVVVAALGLLALADLPPLPDSPYLPYQFAAGLTAVPIGAAVTWRRPGHRLGPVLLASGVAMWLTFAAQPGLTWLSVHAPDHLWVVDVLLACSVWTWIAARGAFLVLVPLVFPAPRPVGAWRRSLWSAGALATAVTCLAHGLAFRRSIFEGHPPDRFARIANDVEPWGFRAIFAFGIASIVTMLVTVVRMDGTARRRHLPFALVAAVLLLPSMNNIYGAFAGHGFADVADEVELWATIALPVVLAVGIVRFGLLDIEVVLRRATAHAATAAVVIAAYVVAVWVASTVLTASGEVDRGIGTAVAALVVMPVHVRLRSVVERRIFGSRRSPAMVVGALSQVARRSTHGTGVLEDVCATIRDQLRLPFVAVDLRPSSGAAAVRCALAGTEPGAASLLELPIVGAEGDLGSLVLAPRTAREAFDARELDALRQIAAQVAVIADNVVLTDRLRASRRSLVEAREEERRRVRRDLHDGLGPTLASVCLGLGAASDRLGTDTELGVLLTDLEGELRGAIVDIRRLVHELRPPALDELGLVGALREHVDALGRRAGAGGTRFALEVEGDAEGVTFPAAAEVAAYRIALEAVNNAVRHARPSACEVRLVAASEQLRVEVRDDGVGIAEGARHGVGLRSMIERAAELGGRLQVGPARPHGTLVVATLPLGPGAA